MNFFEFLDKHPDLSLAYLGLICFTVLIVAGIIKGIVK